MRFKKPRSKLLPNFNFKKRIRTKSALSGFQMSSFFSSEKNYPGSKGGQKPENRLTSQNEENTKITQKRIVVFTAILLGLIFLLWGRLYAIQISKHEHYKNLWKQSIVKVELPSIRGEITDRTGKVPYAITKTSGKSLYIIPNMLDAQLRAELAMKISGKLGLNANKLYNYWKKKAERKFLWVKRKLSDEQIESLDELIKQFGVIGFREENERMYPYKNLLAQMIGFTNVDDVGIAGIEKRFENELKGNPGFRMRYRDARGVQIADTELEQAITSPGANVMLSISHPIQEIVEEELKKCIENWQPKSATAIVMNPHTGEILALSVLPSYDANKPGIAKPENRKIKAVTDTYEPGSVMKPLIMMAAFQEGRFDYRDENSTIYCENGAFHIVVKTGKRTNRRTLHDVHHYGHLTYRKVLIKSSNCGMAKVGMKLGWEKFNHYLHEYGFGKKTNCGLPGEIGGIMPAKERVPLITTIPSVSMGHSISVTPIQMLRSFSIIANDGCLMRPTIVKRIVSAKGKVLFEHEPHIDKKVIHNPEILTWMRETLALVCKKGGTARQANLDDYGISIGGKTGTAEKVVNGRYSSAHKVCTFVGIAPTDEPKISVMVMVDEPTKHHNKMRFYGGTVAAPVVKQITLRTLKLFDK